MVKTFDLSGDSIIGGTIKEFSSTGIKDSASKTTLVVTDGKISVATASIDTLEGNVVVRGDFKVYGILDAGFVRTTELLTNQRYEKQYLEFASPSGSNYGTGLLWMGSPNKQLLLMHDPDRFSSTENIDIPTEKSYMIGTTAVLSYDRLGSGVFHSNLEHVGTLKNLSTVGEFKVDDHIFYNPISQRLGIGTDNPNGLFSLLDYVNNVEIIISGDDTNGYGKVGTFTTKGFELVTDDTPRLSITETGNITLGHEFKDSTIIRAYGKVGVGVKNPTEQLEVAGNIKFGNRLFANGNAAPTTGVHQVGNIVWNTNPRPGNYIGWVCTASGSPGSWHAFGLID